MALIKFKCAMVGTSALCGVVALGGLKTWQAWPACQAFGMLLAAVGHPCGGKAQTNCVGDSFVAKQAMHLNFVLFVDFGFVWQCACATASNWQGPLL